MPTSEQLINLETRRAVMVERAKAGIIRDRVSPLLRDLARTIRARLERGDMTALTRKRQEKLLADIGELMALGLQEITGPIRQDMLALAVDESKFEAQALNTVTTDAFESVTPAAAQIRSAVLAAPLSVRGPNAGKLLDPWIKGWQSFQIEQVQGVIRQGFYEGRTNAQMINSVVGTMSAQYRDGEFARIKRGAEALVRTGVQHAAMEARAETLRENGFERYEWVSTLDGRTSAQCFVGETLVSYAGTLQNVFRSQYVGEVFTVTTAAGHKVEGTPNHPVLTPDGFLPLGELQPGQQVISAMLGEVSGISADQKISVPAKIGELFDFVSHQAGSGVVRKRATANDFYGDGRGMDGEVNTVPVSRELSNNIMSCGLKYGKNNFFSLDVWRNSLSALSCLANRFVGRLETVETSEVAACSIQDGVYPCFASADFSDDFTRASGSVKHLNGFGAITDNLGVCLSASERGHDSILFKQACDRGCGYSELSSEGRSGAPFPVEADYVVSVSSELRSCHVYTLECDLGLYNAGGIIVKNCQSLDGQVFEFGKGPLPPIHVGCRSSVSPVADPDFAFLSEDATRASADGPVPADLTYYDWLKQQPAGFQNEALGPTWAKVFRDGGVSADEFAKLRLGKDFQPITLDELAQKAPVVFERAGI